MRRVEVSSESSKGRRLLHWVRLCIWLVGWRRGKPRLQPTSQLKGL